MNIGISYIQAGASMLLTYRLTADRTPKHHSDFYLPPALKTFPETHVPISEWCSVWSLQKDRTVYI